MKKLLLLLGAAVVCLVSPACEMHSKDTLSEAGHGHGDSHAETQNAGH